MIYNLLVENHNNPERESLCYPITVKTSDGKILHGFRFNERMHPEKRLPELWAETMRRARLDVGAPVPPVFIEDLYKFYLRSCLDLMAKYFRKQTRFSFLYEEGSDPLFIPNGSLADAAVRLKNLRTKDRKRTKIEL